jgi:hypothetical protein
MALPCKSAHYRIVLGNVDSANRIAERSLGLRTVFTDYRLTFCLGQTFNQSIPEIDDQDPDKRSHVTPLLLKLHYTFIGP